MEKEPEEHRAEEENYPSELDGPLPRKVQLGTTDASFLLGVVIVCLGLGILAVGFDCSSIFKHVQQRTVLRRDGHNTVGRVNTIHSGRGGSTVSYTFSVNGVDYPGKAQMPNYRFALHESDQLAIRYLPTDPTVNHPADWEWSGLTDLIPEALALFFSIIGAVALAALLRERRLAREGKLSKGVVTNCALDKQQFRVDYEFCTEDGVRIKGHNDCSEQCEVGSRIWIIYLPKKPRRNHSYPLSYFSIVE